jgi:predicted  nucleic acid-binding Zn-ribbon protein
MTQIDMFGATNSSANPIVGLAATMPRPCRQCGSTAATIESTGVAMHHGSLRCGCGQFRGWVSKATYDFVTAAIQQFGRPTEPIVITTKQANSSTGE